MIRLDHNFNGQDSKLIIERCANGWIVMLPMNYPEPPDQFENMRDIMLNVASEIQSVKEPLLREAEQKEKTEEPHSPMIGYIPPKQNVFMFNKWDDLLKFLKDSIW